MPFDIALPEAVDEFVLTLREYEWATDFDVQALGGGVYVVDFRLILPPMPRGIAPEARDMGIDNSSVVLRSETQRVEKFALRLPPLLPQNPKERLRTRITEMVEDASPPAEFDVEIRPDRARVEPRDVQQFTPHVFYDDALGPHPRIDAVARFAEDLLEQYVTQASREGQVGMFWDEYVSGG